MTILVRADDWWIGFELLAMAVCFAWATRRASVGFGAFFAGLAIWHMLGQQ